MNVVMEYHSVQMDLMKAGNYVKTPSHPQPPKSAINGDLVTILPFKSKQLDAMACVNVSMVKMSLIVEMIVLS